MPKVYCATVECEFNNDGKCKANKVALSWHSVMTLWDGRQEFCKCKTFQESQESIELKKELEQWLKGNKNAID